MHWQDQCPSSLSADEVTGVPKDSVTCPATVPPLSLPQMVSTKFVLCSVVRAGSQVLLFAPCSLLCSRGCTPGRQRQPPASPPCPPSLHPVPSHVRGKFRRTDKPSREAAEIVRTYQWNTLPFGCKRTAGGGQGRTRKPCLHLALVLSVAGVMSWNPMGATGSWDSSRGKRRGPIGPPRPPSASAEGRVGRARSCRCSEFRHFPRVYVLTFLEEKEFMFISVSASSVPGVFIFQVRKLGLRASRSLA